jgi:hypothetical protein
VKQVQPRTNGDRVQSGIDRVKRAAVGLAGEAREHPDEALVAVLPVLFAWRLSLKYQMDFADHLLLSELAGTVLSPVLLKAYREWKARPARPILKEVA